MFKDIEEKFKEEESYRKNLIVIVFIFVIYVLVALKMWNYIEINNYLIFVPVALFFLLIYIFIVVKNFLNSLYPRKKWFYVFRIYYSLELFKKNQREKDKKLLINILKQQGVNTRSKVGKILEHYRVIIPRNINEKTTILSIFAFCLSVLAFLYDSNIDVINDKLFTLFIIMFFVIVGYIIYYFCAKQLSVIFSKKIFYIRMEDLLTEIYVKSEIK